LIVEAPLFGVTLLCVLALLPGAVVTLLKRRWLLFGVGWISFGCGWLIGAALLAPPDSPWARWFYGERRMRRARDPERYRASPGRIAAGLGAVVLAVLALGTFGARPAPVLRVSGAALQRSVADSPLENPAALGPCRRLAPGEWRCLRVPPHGSAGVAYRVSVDATGCWRARRDQPRVDGRGNETTGCVTLLDVL